MSAPTGNDAIFEYLNDRYSISRDEIDERSLLFSDGFLDSFSMVELVHWIETTYGVRFGLLDINLDNLDSVERISKYVAARGA